MRILKIELPATLTSTDPDVSLASDSLREQLRRELDALKDDLGEDVRRRVSTYFPSHFTIFVRFFFGENDNSAKVILWIDDPIVRWPSGLFARRAWRLSVPIATHIAKETFEARVKSIGITFNEKRARVVSLAPAGMARSRDPDCHGGADKRGLLACRASLGVGLADRPQIGTKHCART